MLSRTAIEPESRNACAPRLDIPLWKRCDTYKDKFLNWWMGLEFLAHVSSRRRTSDEPWQSQPATPCSSVTLYRLVSDLVRTIKGQSIAWDADLATASGAATTQRLEYPGAFEAASIATWPRNSPKTFRTIGCVLRISRLAAVVQDPKKNRRASCGSLPGICPGSLAGCIGFDVASSTARRCDSTPLFNREYGVLL